MECEGEEMQMGHVGAGKAKLESEPRGTEVLAQLPSRRNTGRARAGAQAGSEDQRMQQHLSNRNQKQFKGSTAFHLLSGICSTSGEDFKVLL